MARTANIKQQYQDAGPSQKPFSTGDHEKQPMTAAANTVLY